MKAIREGTELKRLILPNEVNTPTGRMRLPSRAETAVTSVILYKGARDEGARSIVGGTRGVKAEGI